MRPWSTSYRCRAVSQALCAIRATSRPHFVMLFAWSSSEQSRDGRRATTPFGHNPDRNDAGYYDYDDDWELFVMVMSRSSNEWCCYRGRRRHHRRLFHFPQRALFCSAAAPRCFAIEGLEGRTLNTVNLKLNKGDNWFFFCIQQDMPAERNCENCLISFTNMWQSTDTRGDEAFTCFLFVLSVSARRTEVTHNGAH